VNKIEGTYLNIIRAINNKAVKNFVVNGEN
jgi:hypothetical protein